MKNEQMGEFIRFILIEKTTKAGTQIRILFKVHKIYVNDTGFS